MNVFILSKNPELAARYQVDKHVVKMVLETAQLLSTCHRVLETERAEHVYKKTHVNHPCSLWLRESSANYDWLYLHFLHLLDEYTFRYGKTHKCAMYKDILSFNPVTKGQPTPFALAMPEQYRSKCPVKSYRDYYLAEKHQLFSWTKRDVPDWVKEALTT